MTVCESRRADPGLERGLITPACDHQPGGSVVGGLEKLEALEPVLVVHSACPCGKPAGQLVSAVGRHRDRIDLDDSHLAMMAEVDRRASPSRGGWSSGAASGVASLTQPYYICVIRDGLWRQGL